jgi:hypothetical protein
MALAMMVSEGLTALAETKQGLQYGSGTLVV